MNTIDVTGIPLKELLSIPMLKEADVLAGRTGLERVVTRVNVMEVPDVIDWVRPGELLVTTGYSLRENPGVFLELIPALVQKQVAALGLKVNRFLGRVPAGVLELADNLGLPIIDLPPSTSFSDMVRDVMETVLAQESKQLMALQHRTQSLTRILLEGEPISAFLERLSAEVENPIVLWETKDVLSATSALPPAMLDALSNIPWQDIMRFTQDGIGWLSVDEHIVPMYAFLIPGRRESSVLALVDLSGSCSNIDGLTLERMIPFLGLELMNTEARTMIESKYWDQFLHDWLTGRLISPSDIRLRAKACGFEVPAHAQYRVCTLRWIVIQASQGDAYAALDLSTIQRQLRSRPTTNRFRIHVTILDEQVVMVIHDSQLEHMSSPALQDTLSQWFHSAVSGVTFSGGTCQGGTATPRVSFCVGQLVHSPSELHTSYRESQRIRHVSEICGLQDPLLCYDSLGVFRILYLLPQHAEVRQFKDNILGPLTKYEAQHNIPLLQTLTMFFETNGNIRETAKRLFTHYNTVLYRLEKIRSLLNTNLDDADFRLQCQLALKLQMMENVQ